MYQNINAQEKTTLSREKKKKKVVLIHQGQGHVPCQQAQLSCTEAILLHLLEYIGLRNSVLNTERKSSMV